MLIDHPEVVAALTACHARHERALAGNDAAALETFFWNSPHAVRYDLAEDLHGAHHREVLRLEILALSGTSGIVNLEFKTVISGIDATEEHGRQTQIWMCFPDGWKIVSAHVSLLPQAPSYVEAASARLDLPIHPGSLAAVNDAFNQISQTASFLMEFPLPQSVESAPVFQP